MNPETTGVIQIVPGELVETSTPAPTEYLLVTDTTSEVIKSSTDRFELVKLATLIRKAGGEVTIFKSTNL